MTATDFSGLLSTTVYYFTVNSVEYNILTGQTAPTFQEVADLMAATLDGSGFYAGIVGIGAFADIRVIHQAERGWDSEIWLGHGITGNDLWNNLTGFVDFDPAVPGRGAFAIIINSSNQPEGTAYLAGAADYFFIDEPPVGSIIISGSSAPYIVDVIGPEGAGSILTSGTGFYQIGYIYVPEGYSVGETTFYGNDIYLDGVYSDTSGEIGARMQLRGYADYELEISYMTSGQATLDGLADIDLEFAYDMTSSTILSGTSDIDLEFTFDAAGSILLSGIGEYEYDTSSSWMGSGSITLSGIADIENGFIYEAKLFGDNYYPFNERTGTIANDELAANNLTIDNSIGWDSDAKYISAQRFNRNDYATLSTDISALAISFWHKRDTTDQDSYRVLGGSADGSHWYFAYDPVFFRAVIRNGSNYYHFFNGTDYLLIPDDDQYHFYYIDFFSGSNAVVYVDNVYRGSTVNFFGTAAESLSIIGNGGVAGVNGFGLIDDLRIYSTVRLTAAQREIVYTLSPTPGSLILGGSATIQIVQDSVTPAEVIYDFIPKGGGVFSGQIYSYVGTGSMTLSGNVELFRLYDAPVPTGGIVLQSVSTFHDFGLGYVYTSTGLANTDGIALTEAVADYEYVATGGANLLSSDFIEVVIIGSFWLLLQQVGKMMVDGEAIINLDHINATLSGGIEINGEGRTTAISNHIAIEPSGRIKLQGVTEVSWAPESGYQELGL